MGMKKVYNCDICRDRKEEQTLFGINFTDNHKFKISTPRSTDGVHICVGCMIQLKDQIPLIESLRDEP